MCTDPSSLTLPFLTNPIQEKSFLHEIATCGEFMRSDRSVSSTLGGISIFVAFGGLFVGRMMIYPAAVAKVDFLQRLQTEAIAWDYGHRDV